MAFISCRDAAFAHDSGSCRHSGIRKIVLILALAVILGACGNGPDDILVISERFFIHQVHDIYLNTQQYLGRTIQFEGIFRIVYWYMTGNYYHIVMRYALSCCGEMPIGFDIVLSDSLYPFPPDFAWVEATGVLEIYDDYLVVRATSLIEMEERGSGFVDFAWQ